MIFVDPELCWHVRQAVRPTPAPTSNAPVRSTQHPRAPVVMAHMKQYGREPVSLWRVVNKLTEETKPTDRAQRRWRQVSFWGAVRELQRAGQLFRHYGQICTSDFAFKSRRKPAKSMSTSVRSSACEKPGSNQHQALAGQTGQTPKAATMLLNTMEMHGQDTKATPAKTECARPSPEQISAAAGLIAMRPRIRRRIRKFTGFFQGERIRRMSLFRVPTGETLPACLILRDMIYVMRPPDTLRKYIERYDASVVRRIKNPAAVLLGRLKKGIKERPSTAKTAAARRNGCRPPRPGRKRGRPTKAAAQQIHWQP